MAGRFDLPAHFGEKFKKAKMKSQDRKTSFLVYFSENVQQLCFFGFWDFNFNFLVIKMRQTISTPPVILSFMSFFVAQTSITLKLKS